MADFHREKDLLQRIAKSRETIRRKHKLLLRGKARIEKELGETFKPIVDPLEKLVSKQVENEVLRKNSRNENLISDNEDEAIDDTAEDEDDTLLVQDTSYETADSDNEDESPSPSIESKYVMMLKQNRKRYLDNVFGIRGAGDQLMIGNSPINFKKDYVNVLNVQYPKTVGLLELLFRKEPREDTISSNDLRNYRKIIEATNAYRKKYDENAPINKLKSNKYKHFIAPFFDKSPSRKRTSFGGAGLLPRYKIAKKDMQMDYVYWDDPNELVDRLRLLVAERDAGNHSHVNEIHSIIDELREANIIY